MKRRMRRFTVLTASGGMLLLFAGCTLGLNENVGAFLRDLAREALAAFLF